MDSAGDFLQSLIANMCYFSIAHSNHGLKKRPDIPYRFIHIKARFIWNIFVFKWQKQVTCLLLGDKAFWHCRGLSFQLLFTKKCLKCLQLALISPHISVLLKESPQTRGVLLHYSIPSLQSNRPPTAPPLKPVRAGSLQLAAYACRHLSIYLCLRYKLLFA